MNRSFGFCYRCLMPHTNKAKRKKGPYFTRTWHVSICIYGRYTSLNVGCMVEFIYTAKSVVAATRKITWWRKFKIWRQKIRCCHCCGKMLLSVRKNFFCRVCLNVSAENFSIECNRDSQITRMSAPLFLDSMRLTSIDVYGGNEFLVFSIQVSWRVKFKTDESQVGIDLARVRV